jgi:oligoribonuclease NrnB/cAMP/cGMP phosphodiesterase (DHH superfamily)
MWEIEAIKKMWEIALKNGLLKESEIIHKIIKDIEKGIYQDEAVTDIREEIFEGLIEIESLSVKTKQLLAKAGEFKIAGAYAYVSKYLSPAIETLKEMGGGQVEIQKLLKE